MNFVDDMMEEVGSIWKLLLYYMLYFIVIFTIKE